MSTSDTAFIIRVIVIGIVDDEQAIRPLISCLLHKSCAPAASVIAGIPFLQLLLSLTSFSSHPLTSVAT